MYVFVLFRQRDRQKPSMMTKIQPVFPFRLWHDNMPLLKHLIGSRHLHVPSATAVRSLLLSKHFPKQAVSFLEDKSVAHFLGKGG